jgi:hypothetical protein
VGFVYVSVMKSVMNRYVVFVFLLSVSSFAFGGEFKSKIVTTDALVITVPDDHFLKITNFTQEGGTDRAVVRVTLQGETNDTNGTADVLAASRIDLSTGAAAQNPPEQIARVIIAGPAQVKVRPVLGATLFISYRKERNEGGGGGGGGGGGPTPIFSPTPTATASPTPTATPF